MDGQFDEFCAALIECNLSVRSRLSVWIDFRTMVRLSDLFLVVWYGCTDVVASVLDNWNLMGGLRARSCSECRWWYFVAFVLWWYTVRTVRGWLIRIIFGGKYDVDNYDFWCSNGIDCIKQSIICGNRVTAVLFLFTFGLQLFCVDENGLLDNYDRIFSQSNWFFFFAWISVCATEYQIWISLWLRPWIIFAGK